ncbi:MAG TPA: trypsin-like peptidase domain-containing protein [Nannocystaceae bacterium]|nr:trypsin-like peptidase domain-containing protein [Nannocystaceae bacterium]
MARRFWCPILLALVAIAGCDRMSIGSGDAEAKSAPAPAPVEEKKVEVAPDPPVEPPKKVEVDPKTGTTPEVKPVTADGRIEDEHNTIDVFGAASPATVFVTQKQILVDRFSMRELEVAAGSGTGFIWDSEGHIVTNCHVALKDCTRSEKAANLAVTLLDKKDYDAKLVGFDPFHDIAVLKIEPGSSALVPIRRPEPGHELAVGQKAVAIGNPFGLDHTLTVGVISALGREVKGIGEVTIRGMVQTDAAINPGNSGGPLLDSRGRLIGMNTMIFSTSGSAAGIGFAVPVKTIERVVPQIIRTGGPERVGFGITPLDERLAFGLGLRDVEGFIVGQVSRGSPAEKAGMRSIADAGGGVAAVDIIVGIDDKRVRSFDDLYGALEEKNEGEVVKVSVRRLPENKVVTLDVALIKLALR